MPLLDHERAVVGYWTDVRREAWFLIAYQAIVAILVIVVVEPKSAWEYLLFAFGAAIAYRAVRTMIVDPSQLESTSADAVLESVGRTSLRCAFLILPIASIAAASLIVGSDATACLCGGFCIGSAGNRVVALRTLATRASPGIRIVRRLGHSFLPTRRSPSEYRRFGE
jgi:hypothetical protein